MVIFGGIITIKGITFFIISIFAIILLGYLLGKITVKGVSLGTAGVFLAAILYGVLFSNQLSSMLTLDGADISSNALKIIENIGLVLFVASVGFIAGPNFFSDLKKNYKSYILLGIVIILAAGLTCTACYYAGADNESDNAQFVALMVGLLSGSMTSTPAFSAAKATVAPIYENAVTVGHGISYLFGVIGVVLFVQLVPKFLKADMEEERKKISIVSPETKITDDCKRYTDIDPLGIFAFAMAIIVGIFLGAIKIPLSSAGLIGSTFSLTTTGGVLITSLIFGHFGHVGMVSLKVKSGVLKTFQEFGLIFFLIGAGVAGGAKFLEYFRPVYFLYGVIMTIVPMIVGYFVAIKFVKLSLLNSLGSITGGMTSTPALGALIKVSESEDVASAYAATYPIALISIVLVSQIIIVLLS